MKIILYCEKFHCIAAENEFDDFCAFGFCERCREHNCSNCIYYYTSDCPEFKVETLKKSSEPVDNEDDLPF